ncbi:MAG: flippase-like domain-containing protein [Nitrosopumilus sp.]|nr:flippase-like domain-containing protein [Nitrosopumilus sp.]MDH3735765.1 flippase-like domain-containing protein [Nitrosopumilus sp.]MDH3822404.1 flippase-like domain-containing protein [Nitrosopumilus sp.]MDH3833343.1 flippase-like domain-containing protein [Nitrosopumilus sp.]
MINPSSKMFTVDLIKKKFLWIVLGAIIFYVLLILISDVEKISESFLQINAEFLVLIFALGFASHVVKSFRQKDLLHTLGEKIPPLQNMFIYMSGLSLVTTPGGIGTLIKSIYLKERFDVPTEKSIAVIFIERYHDLLAGTSIIITTLLFYFSTISLSLVVISFAILGSFYLLIKSQRMFIYVYSRLSRIRFISKNLPEVGPTKSFSILTNPKNMTKGWLLSILGWGIDSLAVYVVFLALNVDLGYLLTSQIYFTSLGYGVLSFLPAGIGVNEGLADFLLVRQGLDFSVASSLVILMRLSTVWFSTIIGIVFTRFALKQKIES